MSSSSEIKDDAPVVRPVSAEGMACAWVLPEFSAEKEHAPAPAEPTLDPAEAEQLRAIAHAQGFSAGQVAGRAAGFAEGRAAGLAAAAEETERLHHRLRGWLAALAAPLETLDEEVSSQLSQLATQLARAVIYRELQTTPEDMTAVAREAIAALPVAVQAIVLRCHPDDAPALIAAVGELRLGNAGRLTIEIEADTTVAAGGLLVESRTPGVPSRIDASLQSRWAALCLRLLNRQVPGPADPLPTEDATSSENLP